MRWESWAEFWAMGGYALYVWGSMGVTALLLLLEVWQARQAHASTLAQLQAEQALDAQPTEDETP